MTHSLWAAFEDFLGYIRIDSKETGGLSPLIPYRAQRMALEDIKQGLLEDVHWFVFLKARQLGITTVMLALDIFWLSIFDGIQGAIIFDTDETKEGFRTLIDRMLESMPASHKVPIVKNNTKGLVLRNGSSASFLVAGKRKNNQLGRGKGLNFVHATEVAFWGDPQAMETLQKALAQRFSARLFVFESTANGFNQFHNLWKEALDDDLNKRGTFIGWWAKDEYSVEPGSKMMERYGTAPPTPDEQEKIDIVKARYGHSVTMEQLAWYRHQKDPSADFDSPGEEVPSDSIIEQEYPWHEEEAFITTGSHFFHSKEIADAYKKAQLRPYKGYRYLIGEEFFSIKLEQVRTARFSQLRVWAEPEDGATYCIGADPAYGSSDKSDRYVVQVLRVWADGWEQVAEYCVTVLKTYQFAWVIAHLCGVYRNARLLFELNGPGEAVFNEFRNLQSMAANGALRGADGQVGIFDIFGATRQYLYHRIDAAGSGYSYHWKTHGSNKSVLMNQLRDSFSLGQGIVNSVECVDEMKTIVQDGDRIEGDGSSHDDRVIGLALANRAWIDSERKRLQNEGKTREFEEKKKTATWVDIESQFTAGIVANFFAQRQADRAAYARQTRQRKWR